MQSYTNKKVIAFARALPGAKKIWSRYKNLMTNFDTKIREHKKHDILKMFFCCSFSVLAYACGILFFCSFHYNSQESSLILNTQGKVEIFNYKSWRIWKPKPLPRHYRNMTRSIKQKYSRQSGNLNSFTSSSSSLSIAEVVIFQLKINTSRIALCVAFLVLSSGV